MQFSNLSALSMSALKVLANSNNAVPTGDKRSKQAWIDALELLAAETTISDLSDSEMECFAVAVDVWVAPEMPSEAEQEAISHAADSALMQTVELAPEAPEPTAVHEKVLDSKSDKPGAIAVIAMLLCAIIAIIEATIVIGCATGKLIVHTWSIAKRHLQPRSQPQLDIACA